MSKTKDPDQPPKDNVKRERYTQSLKVMLTIDEISDRADRAAHKVASIQEKEAELKALSTHHKGIIQQEETELLLLSKEVRDRSTYRQVDCERQWDFTAKMYRVVRNDTGEIVEERKLLKSEEQMELPFPEPVGPEPDDEGWRPIPITEALLDLPNKVYAAFEAKAVHTMGEFSDFQSRHGEFWIKDLPGVGSSMAGKIADAAEAFWKRYAVNKVATVSNGNFV